MAKATESVSWRAERDPSHAKECKACGVFNPNRAGKCQKCGAELESKGTGKAAGGEATKRRKAESSEISHADIRAAFGLNIDSAQVEELLGMFGRLGSADKVKQAIERRDQMIAEGITLRMLDVIEGRTPIDTPVPAAKGKKK